MSGFSGGSSAVMVGDSGSGGVKGLVPAPASGDAAAGKYLKADGSFAVPSGTAASSGTALQKGDGSGGFAAATAGSDYGRANVDQNSQSAAYTTVLGDAGKHIYHPSGDNNARTFTIDSNANVAFPVGTTITFVNEINTVTIAITSDTLVLAGTGTTGSRTLAANGVATALKVGTTRWYISGSGLT